MEASFVSPGKPRVTGGIYRAPLKTALPTDANSQLDSAFVELGFVSEDGVTRGRSLSSSNIKEWGGKVVLITEEEDITTIKFKMIEYLNVEVQRVVNGDANVTGDLTTGLAITPGDEMTEHAFVFWQRMRGGVSYRLVVPRAKITEIGDVVYKSNEAVAYDVTITAMTDSAGKPYYEYGKKEA